MAAPISVQQLKDASKDATTLSDFINQPENVMIPRRLAAEINSLQYYLEYMKSFSQRSFETYEGMVSSAANFPSGSSIFVTNDPDTLKNGIYTYNGVGFVKGEYQPENIAKQFVEDKLGGLQVYEGKIKTQDVTTDTGGVNQQQFNDATTQKLNALPFVNGKLPANVVTFTSVSGYERALPAKLSDTVTPYDFGAIGDGKHHPLSEQYTTLEAAQIRYPFATSLTDSIDWCAIQAFFNYCKTVAVKDANISGNFSVNKEVNYVQGHGAVTKTFKGFMRLTATADMHHVIRIAGSFLKLESFYIRKSTGSLKIPYGLFMGGWLNSDSTICSQVESIDSTGFDTASVNLDQNTMFCKLGVLRGGGGKTTTFTFSNPVNSGVSNSQRTTLTVSRVPENRSSVPKLHVNDFQAPNTFVYINNRAYRVESIDKELGTISIFPILVGITEGTGKCVEGAFYHHGGNNAGCVEVGTLSALGGGTGVSEACLYTGTYDNIITESCGVGLVLGANGGDPAFNFNTGRTYFENNTIDFIQSGASLTLSRNAMRSAVALNANKVFVLSAVDYLESNGKYATTNTSGRLGAGDYCINGKVYTPDYSVVKHWSAVNSLDLELGGESGIKQGVMGASQFNINATVNSKLVELFGRSEIGVHIKHPSNSSLAPTGIIKVTLPTGWKINGVDSNTASYTGFYKAPTLFISVLNADSKLALVSIDGLTSDLISSQTVKKGATTARPSAPYTGQSYLDTTLLASGKPIFWNGSAWVDALGVEV